MNNKIRIALERFGWWLLEKSGIFRYLFRRFLSELLFKLELYDINGEETYQFYLNKYKKYK